MPTPKLSKEGSVQVGVSISLTDLAKVDAIAKRLGVSRSMLMRNLVKAGIDDLKVLETIGVVGLLRAMTKAEAAGGVPYAEFVTG